MKRRQPAEVVGVRGDLAAKWGAFIERRSSLRPPTRRLDQLEAGAAVRLAGWELGPKWLKVSGFAATADLVLEADGSLTPLTTHHDSTTIRYHRPDGSEVH